MNLAFRNIILLILASIFISCNGRLNKEKQSARVQKGLALNKIALLENGFSSGLLDSKGSFGLHSIPSMANS